MLRVGDEVKIKNTDMSGVINRVGAMGLYAVTIKTEHSAFDRTVYGTWELEKVGGNE